MGDINTFIIDFGNYIPATAALNEDGSVSIFLNARVSMEQRMEAYQHELRHYAHDDFRGNISVDIAESLNNH